MTEFGAILKHKRILKGRFIRFVSTMDHYAGFISVVGLPNAGKSSIINALTETNLSIVTPRPQTTRTKLISIWNSATHQLILCDTPGYIEKESYLLHRYMNNVVSEAFTDADALLLVIDAKQDQEIPDPLVEPLKNSRVPLTIFLNKTDLAGIEKTAQAIQTLQARFPQAVFLSGSALNGDGVDTLRKHLIGLLSPSPAFYDKEDLSDRHIRFFVGEIIRASIFELFEQEIPYHTEVVVEAYQELENMDRITCYVITERESQKKILIGAGGKAIKALGIRSREALEDFLDKKVHLELTVKTGGDWRNNALQLKQFGYNLK